MANEIEIIDQESGNAQLARAHDGSWLTPTEVRRQINLIQRIMADVMLGPTTDNPAGVHYGLVPGCGDKPVLLQAGAQKLNMTFRLVPKREVDIIDLGNGHREVRVTTRLYSIDGTYMGEGVGTCSSLETKYRYRNAKLKCPVCGGEYIIKGRDEYGGGWLCYKKAGGCGEKYNDGNPVIEKQERGKIENPDPADIWNTVEKMAAKRADVHATIGTLAAGDLFAQDIDENPELYGGRSATAADVPLKLEKEEKEEALPKKQKEQEPEREKEDPKGEEKKSNGKSGPSSAGQHTAIYSIARRELKKDQLWVHGQCERLFKKSTVTELTYEEASAVIEAMQTLAEEKKKGGAK